MQNELLNGLWPLEGATKEEITRVSDELLMGNASWGETPIMGFPSMSPHEFGLSIFNAFQARHTNAILTHTRGNGEKGFDGIKKIERAVISMVGQLLGDKNVDGYVTSGGTEANMMGVWIGREKLRKELPGLGDERISVLASSATHYSLRKACAVLGLGEGQWKCEGGFYDTEYSAQFIPAENGSGLNLVKCEPNGSIDVGSLKEKIHYLYDNKGIRRFIIFLNEGTTMTGAMDDVVQVSDLVKSLNHEYGGLISFYVHVDAAYGGFIYPFLKPRGTWGFRENIVDSMTVDPYKMGQAPLAQGIFLCRKGLQKYIERSVGYVNHQNDDTLIGSRSGANAAAIWAIICSEGFEGFEKMHRSSLGFAKYLQFMLNELGYETIQELNMVAFYLPDSISSDEIFKMKNDIIDPYHLMWDLFDIDPENPNSKPRRLVKFNITRDVKMEWLEQVLELLGT